MNLRSSTSIAVRGSCAHNVERAMAMTLLDLALWDEGAVGWAERYHERGLDSITAAPSIHA